MISPADCKLIFGNLDQIISLDKKVEADLSKVMDSWNERSRVGECMMRSFDDFKQVYPPYVNHLDKSLALIKNFEENNPKFNAFCKARLAKGNYCSQSLSGNDSNNLCFINHRFEKKIFGNFKTVSTIESPFIITNAATASIYSAFTRIKKANGKVQPWS